MKRLSKAIKTVVGSRNERLFTPAYCRYATASLSRLDNVSQRGVSGANGVEEVMEGQSTPLIAAVTGPDRYSCLDVGYCGPACKVQMKSISRSAN